jgi:hypothetical protein
VTPWLILLALAVVFEAWGYFDGRRVWTLSRVVWQAVDRHPWLRIPGAVFLGWLIWHWFG